MKKAVVKKEMLYSLLIPYILLGVVGVMFFGYVYRTSLSNINNEVLINNESILNKVIREVDYLVNDIERLVVEIDENYKFKRLLDVKEQNKSGVDNYEIAIALKELKSIKRYNHLIEDIIVYYEKGNFFLNSKGLRDEKILYTDYEKDVEVDYAEWTETLKGYYEEGKLIRKGNQIFYIVTIPFREVEKSNVVIKINTIKFEELINSYNNLNEGRLYVLDGDFQEIATNKSGMTIEMEIKKGLINQLESQEKGSILNPIQVGGEKYLGFYAQANTVELKYAWIIEKSKLQDKSNYIIIAFMSLGILFVLFLILGIYGVKNNYEKIENIIERLSKSNITIQDKKQSEMNYINDVLNVIEEKIKSQESIMIETVIRKALYGLVEEQDEDYETLLKKYGELCEGQSIIAVFEESKGKTKEVKDLKLNVFVLENILKEVLGKKVKSWILPIYNWQVLILNWSFEEEYELDYILDSLERIRKFLADQLDITYTVGVSSPVVEINQFGEAYKESIEALEEKQVIGLNRIIYYGNIQEHHNQYQYDENMRKQLVNYIKLGDIEKTNQFIEQLYENNFTENQVSAECGKLFILEIVDTLVEIAKELDCEIQITPADVLKDFYTVYDMKEKIHHIATELCKEGVQSKENIEGREEKILKYIQENYHDVNLNVAMVAETFGLNASYLSRIFKEQTGENLLSYINSYRVEKAKELLAESNKSIANIAMQIGFANVAALTRAFKKYEGITPGQYKAIHKQDV